MSTLSIVVGIVVKELLEYWLGKTDKTKSGSVLEVILTFVKDVFKRILGDKNG